MRRLVTVVALALWLGICGCSVDRVSKAPDNTAAATPVAWSLADLPSANLSEATIRSILAKAEAGHYRLDFDSSDGAWSLADEEATARRMSQVEIRFLFNGAALGTGDQGLANLRKLLTALPRGTHILADHSLICQKNRWSERVLKIREESAAQSGVTISCDGAA
jgi:hypothetical protein